MSAERGDYSREALAAVIGWEALEDAERQALAAPPPSLDAIELVRRIFGSIPDDEPAELAQTPGASACPDDHD